MLEPPGDRIAVDEGSSSFRSYIDYTRLLVRSATAINTLLRHTALLGTGEGQERLARTLSHLEEGAFSIAVVGEFKRGKSTLINALLGSGALPTDAMPATAAMTRVVYGRAPEATLVLRDGRREAVPIEELPRHITKIDDDAARRAAEVEEAIVAYPTLFCQNNVQIVDTPGLSDEEAMTRLTLEVIPTTDAAILAISALAPFARSEAAFLERLLESVDPGRIFFVITHIDRLADPGALDRLLGHIEQRLRATIEQAGRGDGQLRLHLYPASPFQALVAKQTRDHELYERSRFGRLEQALERYLARNRGAAILAQAVQVIREAGEEQTGVVAARQERLQADEAAAVRRHEARLAELEEIRRAVAAHVAGLETRIKARRLQVVELARSTRSRALELVGATVAAFPLDDALLADGERRNQLVGDALRKAVLPLIERLHQKLAGSFADWDREERAALAAIGARLDAALADRAEPAPEAGGLPVPVGESAVGGSAMVPALPETIDNLPTTFRTAFQPTAGLIGDAALGVAGRVLGNETVQEGWRALRGFFDAKGREQADVQLRGTREQIRARMREAYSRQTTAHLEELFKTLQVRGEAAKSALQAGETLAAVLAREQELVVKLADWREVELRIERERHRAESRHTLQELQAMEAETRRIVEEAERHAEILTRALSTEETMEEEERGRMAG